MRLRFDKPHHSHQLMDDAIAFARKVGAKQTLIIHVCHDVGLHDEVNLKCCQRVLIWLTMDKRFIYNYVKPHRKPLK